MDRSVDIYVHLTFDNSNIERITTYKYCRIEQARQVFIKMEKTLTSCYINILLQCYMIRILLYCMDGIGLKRPSAKRWKRLKCGHTEVY